MNVRFLIMFSRLSENTKAYKNSTHDVSAISLNGNNQTMPPLVAAALWISFILA